MDNNKINKISKYILIGFGLLVVGSFMRDIFIYGPRLREKGRYTIGYTYKYSQYKGGSRIYYKYKVRNKLYYSNAAVGGIKKNRLLEKRFLVRYVYDDIDLEEILLVYPVPDSIKEAPPEGWEKLPEWASDKIRWFNTK